MPVILRFKSWKFFFYSNEGNPREPAHIHVRGGSGAEAKFWLDPVSLARSVGFTPKGLLDIERVVIENRQMFLEAWNEYFA